MKPKFPYPFLLSFLMLVFVGFVGFGCAPKKQEKTEKPLKRELALFLEIEKKMTSGNILVAGAKFNKDTSRLLALGILFWEEGKEIPEEVYQLKYVRKFSVSGDYKIPDWQKMSPSLKMFQVHEGYKRKTLLLKDIPQNIKWVNFYNTPLDTLKIEGENGLEVISLGEMRIKYLQVPAPPKKSNIKLRGRLPIGMKISNPSYFAEILDDILFRRKLLEKYEIPED